MSKKKKAAVLAKLASRRTLRLLGILGTVMAVCAAVVSALGALLMVRQLQLVSAQKKALPVLQRAAQVYLDQNAPQEEPAARGLFRHRKAPDPVPAREAEAAKA